MTILKTERLVLRPFRREDRDALFAVFSHPEAMRYWSTPPHATPEVTAGMIEASIGGDPASHLELVIELEGKVIGKAGLWQVPEIGYIIHPDYWRLGIAEEALRALIAHGFEDMRLTEITADVDPDNQASIALLTKLGFRETGRAEKTIEIAGTWYDSVYFALEPSEKKDPPA
ncbi:GNAT family N-acetyltransferase [Marimonas sp. MJW-29]|uniref:GNAT family N-acetyltransferase n=1 Tax=Sulfitobacter sediminis TaxID=3234186 RepID=A0ABV3RTH1_9RHOB